ncbi:hypothetical protein BGP_5497 [Beggiatoa sp. PS]|nr:hypothetical protein BGP_5497 [Beggiatoa sp. PS]
MPLSSKINFGLLKSRRLESKLAKINFEFLKFLCLESKSVKINFGLLKFLSLKSKIYFRTGLIELALHSSLYISF